MAEGLDEVKNTLNNLQSTLVLLMDRNEYHEMFILDIFTIYSSSINGFIISPKTKPLLFNLQSTLVLLMV